MSYKTVTNYCENMTLSHTTSPYNLSQRGFWLCQLSIKISFNMELDRKHCVKYD